MKLFETESKKFKLPKLSATVGRELMTKGQGLKNIFSLPAVEQMKFFSKVEVHLLGDTWVPLSTITLLDNHLTDKGKRQLLKAFLQYNGATDDLLEMLNQPTVVDRLWLTAEEILDEVFNEHS